MGFFIFTIDEPVEVGSNLHSWQPVVFCLYLGHCLRNKKENFWDVKKPQPTFFPSYCWILFHCCCYLLFLSADVWGCVSM